MIFFIASFSSCQRRMSTRPFRKFLEKIREMNRNANTKFCFKNMFGDAAGQLATAHKESTRKVKMSCCKDSRYALCLVYKNEASVCRNIFVEQKHIDGDESLNFSGLFLRSRFESQSATRDKLILPRLLRQ